MIRQWFNWRSIFTLVALFIVSGTIFYSNYLAKKIASEERQKVETWVEAQRTILNATENTNLNLATRIATENDDIPIIETNEKDSITGNYLNIDTIEVKANPNYLTDQLDEFKKLHSPIILLISEKPYMANRYYYGESKLQTEVRYYPIIQLIILAMFIGVAIIAQRSRYQNTQNHGNACFG